MCRDCYKTELELRMGIDYIWDDLNGKRPTREEYEAQEGMENA